MTGAHRRWPLPVTGCLWWSLIVPSWSHVPNGLECPWLPGKRAHVVLFFPQPVPSPPLHQGPPSSAFWGVGWLVAGAVSHLEIPAPCCKGIVIVVGTPQPREREFVP